MLSAAGSDPQIAALRSDIQRRQRLDGMRHALTAIKGTDPLRRRAHVTCRVCVNAEEEPEPLAVAQNC